jgi:hypothetical protein
MSDHSTSTTPNLIPYKYYPYASFEVVWLFTVMVVSRLRADLLLYTGALSYTVEDRHAIDEYSPKAKRTFQY